jgi:RNA polymerase sigma-70 factor (ECF subfamily)
LQENITDEELVKGCAKEVRKYQAMLYEKFNQKMFSVCYRYAKDRDQALDMLQEGFIKVYNHIGNFSHTGSLEGWIRRIMVNTSINHLRKNKYHADVNDYAEFLPTKKASIIDKLSADDIFKLIRKLPLGYKTVFNMFAVEGYSHREIAETLGIKESTSRTQYLKAKKSLQQMLSTQEEFERNVRE